MTFVTKLVASETNKQNLEWKLLFYCHVMNLFHSVYQGRTYAHTWLMTNALYSAARYGGLHKPLPTDSNILSAYATGKYEEATYLLKHFKTTGTQADAFRKIIKFGELAPRHTFHVEPLCSTLIERLEEELPHYLLAHNITRQKGFKVVEVASAVLFFLNQVKVVKPETVIIGALIKAISTKRPVVMPQGTAFTDFMRAVETNENITTHAMNLPKTPAWNCIKNLVNIYTGDNVC